MVNILSVWRFHPAPNALGKFDSNISLSLLLLFEACIVNDMFRGHTPHGVLAIVLEIPESYKIMDMHLKGSFSIAEELH